MSTCRSDASKIVEDQIVADENVPKKQNKGSFLRTGTRTRKLKKKPSPNFGVLVDLFLKFFGAGVVLYSVNDISISHAHLVPSVSIGALWVATHRIELIHFFGAPRRIAPWTTIVASGLATIVQCFPKVSRMRDYSGANFDLGTGVSNRIFPHNHRVGRWQSFCRTKTLRLRPHDHRAIGSTTYSQGSLPLTSQHRLASLH